MRRGVASGTTQATFVSHLVPEHRNVLDWTPSKAACVKNKLNGDIDLLAQNKILAEQAASMACSSMNYTTDGN